MNQSTVGFVAEAPVPRRPATMVELPLSPQQRRWWYLCTAYPGASSPVVFLVHRLRGALATDAWVRAVSAVVNRHEVLRTRFVPRDGGPVQVVGPPDGIEVERIDLGGLPEADREGRARELLNERRQVLFDLTGGGPLVASALLRLADDDHIWTMTIHHILADGASLAIIDRELSAIYPALLAGTEPALAELPVQYGDFAVWYDSVEHPQHDDDLRYWLDRLAGVPSLELRTDLPRPARKGAAAAQAAYPIGAELAGRVDELARAERCTRFMVLLAGLQVLLARHSGQHDFCIGVPVIGGARARAELAPLVGLFSNTLAMRCDLSGDPTFRALLASTRDAAIDAFDHQDLPFSRVLARLPVPHDPSRAPAFQVLFVFDEFDAHSGLRLPGLNVAEFPLGVPKILHDLMLVVRWSPAGAAARFVYDTGLFRPARMAAMAREYADLLGSAVVDPGCRLADLVAGGDQPGRAPAGA